jgi:hypothetical protein
MHPECGKGIVLTEETTMKSNSALRVGTILGWAGPGLIFCGLVNMPLTPGQHLLLNDSPAGTAVIAGVALFTIGAFLFWNGLKDSLAKN